MEQIIGHQNITRLFEQEIRSQQVHHSYLLSGSEHIGKMTLAIEFAKSLLCTHPENERGISCGDCPSCKKIVHGNHPDVSVITPGDNKRLLGIDVVREVQHSASLQPYEGKYRIFIIPEVELMTPEAANCLLKTLEEPGPATIIILTTTDQNKVLPTIKSRCQIHTMYPISKKDIEEALITKFKVATMEAKKIGDLAGGKIGWAINAATDPEMLEEREQWLIKLFDLVVSNKVQRFKYVSSISSDEKLDEILNLWVEVWRDILISTSGAMANIQHKDCLKNIEKIAQSLSLEQARGFMSSLLKALEQIEQNVSPRLALEVLMLDFPDINVITPQYSR